MRIPFDLKSLQCLVVLAEVRSFSLAAEQLAMSQPSLSSRIAKLEAALGDALFERSTRVVKLTPFGAEVLPEAKGLVTQAEVLAAAIARRREAPACDLSIGAPLYLFGMPEHDALLEALERGLEGASVHVNNGFSRNLFEALDSGEIDLTLALGVAQAAAREDDRAPWGELAFPDTLPRMTLRRERVRLILPAEHPLAQEEQIAPAMLQGLPVAMLSKDHGAALRDPLVAHLAAAGAQLTEPPVAHAMGLERHCRQHRAPSIALGWFGTQDDGDVVYRQLGGLLLDTELALLRPQGPFRTGLAERAWAIAARLFAR